MEKHFFYYNIYFSRFCYCHSVILFMYGIIMNFDLREEQQLLQKTVKEFTEQKLIRERRKWIAKVIFTQVSSSPKQIRALIRRCCLLRQNLAIAVSIEINKSIVGPHC